MDIKKQQDVLLLFLTTPCNADCRGCELLEICNSITEYMQEKGLWSFKSVKKMEVVENEN